MYLRLGVYARKLFRHRHSLGDFDVYGRCQSMVLHWWIDSWHASCLHSTVRRGLLEPHGSRARDVEGDRRRAARHVVRDRDRRCQAASTTRRSAGSPRSARSASATSSLTLPGLRNRSAAAIDLSRWSPSYQPSHAARIRAAPPCDSRISRAEVRNASATASTIVAIFGRPTVRCARGWSSLRSFDSTSFRIDATHSSVPR